MRPWVGRQHRAAWLQSRQSCADQQEEADGDFGGRRTRGYRMEPGRFERSGATRPKATPIEKGSSERPSPGGAENLMSRAAFFNRIGGHRRHPGVDVESPARRQESRTSGMVAAPRSLEERSLSARRPYIRISDVSTFRAAGAPVLLQRPGHGPLSTPSTPAGGIPSGSCHYGAGLGAIFLSWSPRAGHTRTGA